MYSSASTCQRSEVMLKVYGSKYCQPCKVLKKFLVDLRVNYKYVSIDSDEGMSEFAKLNVDSIPVMVFSNGNMFVGCPRSKEKLKEVLMENGEIGLQRRKMLRSR